MTAAHVIAFAQQHRAPDDYLYLLLDGLADCAPSHPLSVASLTDSLGEAAVTRVLRPDLAHAPDACPALIQLAGPGAAPPQPYLELSARYAREDMGYRKRYVCGWLLSPEPPEVVARHIVLQCRAIADAVFPWFEPLRLELLAACLGSQIGGVLMPVRAWLCPTGWASHALLRSATDRAPREAALSSLAGQSQRAASLIGDLLGIWRLALAQSQGFSPWRWKGPSVLPPQAGAHAFRLVRDARRVGLNDSGDIIALSLHRLFIHPHLPMHPEIQRDIAAAAGAAGGLQARFETYDDATWMRIAASLPHAERYT